VSVHVSVRALPGFRHTPCEPPELSAVQEVPSTHGSSPVSPLMMHILPSVARGAQVGVVDM